MVHVLFVVFSSIGHGCFLFKKCYLILKCPLLLNICPVRFKFCSDQAIVSSLFQKMFRPSLQRRSLSPCSDSSTILGRCRPRYDSTSILSTLFCRHCCMLSWRIVNRLLDLPFSVGFVSPAYRSWCVVKLQVGS